MKKNPMERFKKGLILFLGFSLLLILLQCSKYNEPAPFFDGLFLEYDYGGGLKRIYNIHVLDNNKFKVIERNTFFKSSDYDVEMYVDKHGKVYKTNRRKTRIGKFSPIWIPVHIIEIGNTIFDGSYTAIRKDKWKGWDVLVFKADIVEEEKYFDLNTGFWVGSLSRTPMGTGKIVLVNTNADIPTVEE